jgi:tetratricopeptide (TPR) repeat protein
MLGNYAAALDHYGKALKIDATFTTSQLGIASTHALMGNEERARAEYLKAIPMAKERPTQMDYRILWAMTFYRENQLEQGRQELTKIAADAHAAEFALQEAEAHRDMALFNPDPQGALKDLQAAQAVLSEKHPISRQDRDTELATILQTRAFVAARAGLADVAQKALEPLSAMAKTSRSNLIQHSYHSANGAALLAQGKFAEAIVELQEDPRNPLSLQLLSEAQNKAGHAAEAQKTLETLALINDERVETAFAVPQARAALKRNQSTAVQGGGN